MERNNDPAPSMPVRPMPADLALYNAWAVRNNQPRMGAVGDVQRAPLGSVTVSVRSGKRAVFNSDQGRWELVVGGRRGRVSLTKPDGSMTPDGAEYSRVARQLGVANFQLQVWQPGLHMDPATNADFAYTVDGRKHIVRRFDVASGRYMPTIWGMSYFRDHRSQFTISLPVMRLVRKKRANGTYYYSETNNGDEWRDLTDEDMLDYVNHHSAAHGGGVLAAGGLAGIGIVPANSTPEAQRAWIKEALAMYISLMPMIGGYRQLLQFDASECTYVYDSRREPKFDEQISYLHHAGPMVVQLVLNRPLRGIVVVPDEMYGKTGIYPVAWEETPEGENCVLNQLVLAITKRRDKDSRVRIRNRKWVNGK